MQDPEATQPIQRKQRHLATRLLFFASGASVTLFYFCLCLFLSSAPVSFPCFLIPLSTVSTAQQPATSTLLALGEISLSPGDDPMKKKKKKKSQIRIKISCQIHLQDSAFSEKVFLFPSWYFLISSSGIGSIPGSLHRLSARCTLPFLR